MTRTRNRLLVLNEPGAMRINKHLAAEIGFSESIVFLQIEFLLSVYGEQQGDRLWLRISLDKLQGHFTWWSVPTISRVLQRLKELEILDIDNRNACRRDQTQSYALNERGIARLRTVRLSQIENSPPPDEGENGLDGHNLKTAIDQDDRPQSHNLQRASDQTDRLLRRKGESPPENLKEITITPQFSATPEIPGGGDGSTGSDSAERTPLEIWLGDEVGLVTAREFRDWPDEPTRARVRLLLQGRANQAMIVAELRARKGQIFAQASAAHSSAAPDATAEDCPDWIAPADWLLLTAVQRDAYAESRLIDGGLVAGRYPELDGVINGRFKVTTERLIQARRGAA
jgi:DNA-binding PadR family transcriptional regulator